MDRNSRTLQPESAIQSTRAPAIVFDRVSLSFDGNPLFKDLSMTIDGGKCTCILGPSGCGKSTLLRLVSGTNTLPYSGRVRICSESGNNGHDKTAWMSQNDLLLPWFSLLDNILLGSKLRKAESQELREQAYTLLTRAGLSGYGDSYPAALSGGYAAARRPASNPDGRAFRSAYG